MEVERFDAYQPTMGVEVHVLSQRCNLCCSLDNRGAQPPAILDGHTKSFHQRTCVLAEPLLPRNERVAVMGELHRARLHVGRSPNIMMRSQNEAGSFAL